MKSKHLMATVLALAVATVSLFGQAQLAQALSHTTMQDLSQWSEADGVTGAGPFGWAHTAIEQASGWEILTGYPQGLYQVPGLGIGETAQGYPTFRPQGTVTHAEFVALLSRMAGFNDKYVGDSAPFRDVQADAWYMPYLEPLYRKGVVRLSDRPGDMFLADRPITRAEIAGWVARAAAAYGVSRAPSPLTFTDRDAIAGYWQLPVSQAVTLGIVHGYPDGTFRPDSTASRAEATVMIMRLLPYMANHAPDSETLRASLQDALDAFASFQVDTERQSADQVDYRQMQLELSPHFTDSALTGWVHPDMIGVPVHNPDGFVDPSGFFNHNPFGFDGFSSLVALDSAVRRGVRAGSVVGRVEAALPVESYDRVALLNATITRENAPADRRARGAERLVVPVYMKLADGRWKVSGMGSAHPL